MSPRVCARPGCANPVTRVPGRPGRPPVYCSPGCRPSRARWSDTIAVDAEQVTGDGHEQRATGRDWLVRVSRGQRSAVVAHDLGRFSATVLANELRSVLEPARRATRTIE